MSFLHTGQIGRGRRWRGADWALTPGVSHSVSDGISNPPRIPPLTALGSAVGSVGRECALRVFPWGYHDWWCRNTWRCLPLGTSVCQSTSPGCVVGPCDIRVQVWTHVMRCWIGVRNILREDYEWPPEAICPSTLEFLMGAFPFSWECRCAVRGSIETFFDEDRQWDLWFCGATWHRPFHPCSLWSWHLCWDIIWRTLAGKALHRRVSVALALEAVLVCLVLVWLRKQYQPYASRVSPSVLFNRTTCYPFPCLRLSRMLSTTIAPYP